MKKWLICLVALFQIGSGAAQNVWMTRTGQISFFSKTPMENIEAINNEVSSMINTQNGDIVFAVLIKGFRFERALMEEHFNENYLESDKFPKASFQGRILNVNEIDFKTNGIYKVMVEGELTMHGVKQKIKTEGQIKVADGKLEVTSQITVLLTDYKIERPALVAEKISEKIDTKVKCIYEPKV